MSSESLFLPVSQPTQGVDVGGTAFIHEMIREQRTDGAPVPHISSDLDEILALSDRIGVMYRGQLVAVLPRAEATRERVGRFMLPGTDPGLETVQTQQGPSGG